MKKYTKSNIAEQRSLDRYVIYPSLHSCLILIVRKQQVEKNDFYLPIKIRTDKHRT